MRSTGKMKKNTGDVLRGSRGVDYAAAAMQHMELYCAAHPGSPSAVRRPQLFIRGELWMALLGPSVEEGIVGIGPTVTAALRAFDAQYLAGLRPPAERPANVTASRRTDPAAGRTYRYSKVAPKSRSEASDVACPS
jgi:hypothetical protein